MKKYYFIYIIFLLFANSIHGQNTVSVPFNNGFVGDVNGTNSSLNSYYLNGTQGLGWTNISFSQESSAGIFTLQGNDIIGYLKITDYNGNEFQVNGFITWRTPSGNDPHTMVFRPSQNNLILSTNGYNGSNTYLIDENSYIGLTRNGSSLGFTAPGTVSGNSATNGLLDALNNILLSLPRLTISGDVIHFTETSARVGISLSDPSQDIVTVTLSTRDGTALKTVHYDSISLVINIPSGQTYYEATIPVNINYTPTVDYYFDAIISNSSNASISKSIDSILILTNALPVEFLGMQYECLDQQGVSLTWQTASELNAQHFEVMRSEDGFTWEQVGTVTATGTSNQLSEYQFVDEKPVRTALRYYQLKQVDFDGNFEWLPIISVNCEAGEGMRLYPNPAHHKAYLSIPSNVEELITIQLIDATGRVVKTTKHQITKGDNIVELALTALQNGIYTIVLENDNKQQPLKLIINK